MSGQQSAVYDVELSCDTCGFSYTDTATGAVKGNQYTIPLANCTEEAKRHARNTGHRKLKTTLTGRGPSIVVTHARNFDDDDLRRPLRKRFLQLLRLESMY